MVELHKGKGLYVEDCDPCDRCRVMRLFKPGALSEVDIRLLPKQLNTGKITIVVQDRRGQNVF